MTPEEKEIRAAERKALAEVRQWRRIAAKKMESMLPAEVEEYYKQRAERLRAQGINIITSEEARSKGIGI